MTSGSTPAVATERIRHRGLQPAAWAASADMTITPEEASFMPEAEPDENIEAMNEASAMVKCGQVTIAARSAKIDGMDIAKGDVIAVAGGSVRFSGSDMQSVAISLAGELVDDDSGVLSLYYGLDADSDEAEAIRDALEDIYPDLDVKMNYGGQDVYPYIIAAE